MIFYNLCTPSIYFNLTDKVIRNIKKNYDYNIIKNYIYQKVKPILYIYNNPFDRHVYEVIKDGLIKIIIL